LGRGLREFKGSISGDHDDEPAEPAKLQSHQPPPPPSESAEAEKKTEDEPVVHDRG
jgi:Sec-independent protein translocase protein TatA